MIGKAGGRIDNVTIQEYRFTKRLTAIPTRQERDEARRQAIHGCLAVNSLVLAVRLSRSIESPSERFTLQMEKFVEPHLYDDYQPLAIELLSDDFIRHAKTLPAKERLPLLAKIAKKLAQINGQTNELRNQIDYVLKEAAKCVITGFQPLPDGEKERLVAVITEQWGNFTITNHHDRLLAWLNRTYQCSQSGSSDGLNPGSPLPVVFFK